MHALITGHLVEESDVVFAEGPLPGNGVTYYHPASRKSRVELRPMQDVDQGVVAVRFDGLIFNGREPNSEGYETIPPSGESSYGICPGD